MRWPLGRERPAQEQNPRHPKDAQVIALLESLQQPDITDASIIDSIFTVGKTVYSCQKSSLNHEKS